MRPQITIGVKDRRRVASNKYDLEQRLIRFSVAIIKMTADFPVTYEANHLKKQLIRSGTSPALNYGEAQAAESDADFIHKMKICLKELRESQICLKIISAVPILEGKKIEWCSKECGELVAIFTASIKTAQTNKKK